MSRIEKKIYNDESQIKTVEDVKVFFHYLVEECNLNLHPDDDFADYVCNDGKTSVFSADEVEMYKRLMGEAFEVCENAGEDIYGICMALLHKTIENKIA